MSDVRSQLRRQFYFGAVGELPRYRLGETVAWGPGPRFGSPSMPLVYALAYNVREPACESCGTASIVAELEIREGRLVHLTSPRAISHTRALLYEGVERKPRCHDDLYS